MKDIERSKYIYQNELHKACFQHDIAKSKICWISTWACFSNLLIKKPLVVASLRITQTNYLRKEK